MKDNNKKVWASRFAHLFRVHNSLKVNIPYGRLNQIIIKGECLFVCLLYFMIRGIKETCTIIIEHTDLKLNCIQVLCAQVCTPAAVLDLLCVEVIQTDC